MAHHADHRAVTIDCTVQQTLNGGQLPPSTNKIRLGTVKRVMPFLHTHESPGRHRLIGTLDLNELSLAESRCAINQPCGGLAAHHLTR